MGWGGAVDRITGMVDRWLGLSPEQRKIKRRNLIDKLEAEKRRLTNEAVSLSRDDRIKHMCRIADIDEQLQKLNNEAKND